MAEAKVSQNNDAVDVSYGEKVQNHQSRKGSDEFTWTRSDNAFAFNFVLDSRSVQPSDTSVTNVNSQPNPLKQTQKNTTLFTGKSSDFAFNFPIPDGKPEEEDIGKLTPSETVAAGDRSDAKSERSNHGGQILEITSASKAKKKKKSKKKTDTGCNQEKQKESTSSTEGENPPKEDSNVMSAEQQLVRELDWCIEKLELGLRTQKSTPKQKEEASRALKVLRSSKAPLAKKRYVMRSVSGDYRKKMEEEKEKQLKLIHAAMSSAKVKTTAGPAKGPVVHRRAECRAQPLPFNTSVESQGRATPTQASSANTGSENKDVASSFVFKPTQEVFCFNFL